jgi:alpha-galactosidase
MLASKKRSKSLVHWGQFNSQWRFHLKPEISRLIETYQLAWIKLDFNLEMGYADEGLAGYYQVWYGKLDELRQRFPETFFEGCASGAICLDLNTLSHFDGHFLSETVNPVDVLRITRGACCMFLQGGLQSGQCCDQ